MTPTILSNFFQISLHQKIIVIAIPMILSNVTTPLMGMVDTAVLGHMQGTYFLAGASVAALIITQLYWLCGFLRMTSTGLSAQAKGSKDKDQLSQSLFQGIVIGFMLGCILLLFKDGILALGLYFANATPVIEEVISEYFSTRIWGAPAAIVNLALIGWLIGQQQAKQVLLIQVFANLLNLALNLWFVFGLGLEVFGVALASVIAEYFIAVVSLFVALNIIGKPIIQKKWFSIAYLQPLLSLNGNTFFRNLILQACIAFLIFKGVGFGSTSAAINAILMQFFTLIALGLDGVAYAAEALVGEQKGDKNAKGIIQVTLHGLLWSSVVAVFYSLVFVIWGTDIISIITDQKTLQLEMQDYLIFVYCLPLIAHWCFFFDGVFVGLTRAKAMRNSMLLCALAVYFPAFWIFLSYANQGLWMAMLLFLFFRGISLGGYFIYLCRYHRLTS
ncbi:MATE family efflux transporter [Paraglaciecola arctica]|uniref:DNA-damage-inducible protein F n=1 Tax=Paraglaciecola arctica BSs20135 TaxID=493475 RepID=K6XBF6_9ALTE|nr:MATE family efflux transporter [Paraglaciecola arctica]GAC17954.1 DNA-damage-inducible protein F [Paraglaciecola arctica BSs20135]